MRMKWNPCMGWRRRSRRTKHESSWEHCGNQMCVCGVVLWCWVRWLWCCVVPCWIIIRTNWWISFFGVSSPVSSQLADALAAKKTDRDVFHTKLITIVHFHNYCVSVDYLWLVPVGLFSCRFRTMSPKIAARKGYSYLNCVRVSIDRYDEFLGRSFYLKYECRIKKTRHTDNITYCTVEKYRTKLR